MESTRPPICQVVLMDGTFASLNRGRRSSIAHIHALLTRLCGPLPAQVSVHYAPGQQWDNWRTLPELATGATMDRHICAAYSWLAREWRPGNPLFFFGYSRGAFGVRSLAGMIGRVGLLTHAHASRKNVQHAWDLYRNGSDEDVERLDPALCHADVPIRMVGVFDTVMALGVRLPILWMLTEPRYRFHDEQLGDHVEHGVQALALDETRAAFQPLIWNSESSPGRVEQMWFRGCHPDIGGQLAGLEYARPLANIPLVWMLTRASAHGLPLPEGWRDRFPCDATAPSVGSWRNWGKAFLARTPRLAGTDPSEALHASVPRPYTGPALLTGGLSDAAPPRPRRSRLRPFGKSAAPATVPVTAAVTATADRIDDTAAPPMADQPRS